MPGGLTDYFLITEDVDYEYKMRRQDGSDRDTAVREILRDNADYLSTCDDGPQVWIGLAKAMGRKSELTREILEKAESAFDDLAKEFPEEQKLLARYKARACDPNALTHRGRFSYYKVVVYRAPLQELVLHCWGCCGLVGRFYRKDGYTQAP